LLSYVGSVGSVGNVSRGKAKEVSAVSDFRQGDRVVVLRLDSNEIECHGSYAGETGPIMFVQPDDDDLPDPIEVGADRVVPEKRRYRPS